MEKIEKLLKGVKKNISLKNYTSFKIGGKAKYFFIAKSKEALIEAILFAKKNNLPFFILAGGSNLLVADKGFKGLVIRILNTKYYILNTKIIADAGTPLAQLMAAAAKEGLAGLEWAAGIPGTLGGAIYGNAGWPNSKKNISSVITSVEVLDIDSMLVKKYKLKDCHFDYRSSFFKKNKNLIILGASLKLKKGNKEEIKKTITGIIKERRGKAPSGFSAGSVFKNFTPHKKNFFGGGPLVREELKKFKKIGIIPAGYLIEQCGLKGKRIGGAMISKKHANFIVNFGGASAKDVMTLINLAKKSVKNKFGIDLEEEIQHLGF